ncbi:hypothetical protein [Nocardia sp. NPDC002869]|uniref:deazapurine DNA modification protein DpdA family protein n=1 Tax=Nocardia sp. NPDC002869 TaxID=3161032 RepID=UPI00398CDF83
MSTTSGEWTEPSRMRFYLGAHHPGWLAKAGVPLFVSDRTLRSYKTLPRAIAPWALDSGGFTELSTHGTWSAGPSPREYVARVRRYATEVGHLQWAAPQDWMCEPFITAKTGLSVAAHQRRTVDNYRELRDLAPDQVFAPVLQGWELSDYLRCADLYAAAGVDLAGAPVVGVGSVCRRQGTRAAANIVSALTERIPGVRLHGFGIKTTGLRDYGQLLASADSMAWSYHARRRPPLPGHTSHKNCANCLPYALGWRTQALIRISAPTPQLPLFAADMARTRGQLRRTRT